MVNFWGVIVWVLFASFFAWLFGSAYSFGMKGVQEKVLPDMISKVMFLVLAFCGACACYYLLVQNRYVYHWDYGCYWSICKSYMEYLFTRPTKAVIRLFRSFFSDYNSLLATITALPLKIAGYTFVRYVLVNYVLFVVPVMFLLSAVILKHLGKRHTLLCIFMLLTFSQLYLPTLRGYIDVASLIPASVAMILMADYDAVSLSLEQIKRDLYISLTLLCTLVFRRYFVFYVIGYMSGIAMLSLHSVMKAPVSKFKSFVNAVLNIAVIGIFAFVMMAIFFGPMLFHTLTYNYAEMYYSFDAPFIDKLLGIVRNYGIFTFILAGLGVILPFCTGKMKRSASFCAVSIIAASLNFFHIHGMGLHHCYIIAPQIFLLLCISLIQITELLKKRVLMRVFVPAVCLLVIGAGSIYCWLPASRKALSPISGLFRPPYTPLVRNDIPALNELVDYVNSMTDGTEKQVYVLALNGYMSISVVDMLRMPDESPALQNMSASVSYEDLGGGFPVGLLKADIVITTDPIILNFKKGHEHVVKFPAEEIRKSDSPFGRHFTKNPREFILDDGVKVLIYEKISEFEPSDLQYIADYFSEIYPGRDDLFADRIFGRARVSHLHVVETTYGIECAAFMKWLMLHGVVTPEFLASYSKKLTVHHFKDYMNAK